MSPQSPDLPDDLPQPKPAWKISIMARLRNYFLTGLIVAAPIALTLFIARWFIQLVDTWFVPLLPEQYQPDRLLPFNVPGLGLLMAVVFLTVLGAVTANFLGRAILNFAESLVERMPIVRTIYGALKQIFETAISQSTTTFREVALLEYPRPGIYRVVFVTSGKTSSFSPNGSDAELVSVFMPTTPNITSGQLLYVSRSDLTPLDMSVEEGAKLIISAGLVDQNGKKKV